MTNQQMNTVRAFVWVALASAVATLFCCSGCAETSGSIAMEKQGKYCCTLYAADGKAIKTWTCDEWRWASQPLLLRNGKPIARISGTYIIEPIDK